jgi:G3E family GTPase
MTIPDIVVVSREEFLVAKDRVATAPPCEKLQRLYTSLFKDYECFSKSEHSLPNQGSFSHTSQHSNNHSSNSNKFSTRNNNSNNHHTTNSKYLNKGHFNNHHSYGGQKSSSYHGSSSLRPSKPITKVFDSSLTNDPMGEVKKKLKGLLNIINKNNYKKVVSKVKSILNQENAQTVYEIILSNTCNQVFYINVFIVLIMELIAFMPSTQEVCRTVVNTFIENFIYQKEYIMVYNDVSDGITSDYDVFCAQQKHKSMITSKNLVIVEFLKKSFSKKWTVQSYADGLLNSLNNLNTDAIVNSNISLETNTDIILTLLKDLKNVDKRIKLDTSIIARLFNYSYNQRITFMAQDIISLEWQGIGQY